MKTASSLSSGIRVPAERNESVVSIATSLAPAHQFYYPCTERAGTEILDSVTASKFIRTQAINYYDNPYSIGCGGGNNVVTPNNVAKEAGPGDIFIWYISADMWPVTAWEVAALPHPISGNFKLSFNHINIRSSTFDIQGHPINQPGHTGVAVASQYLCPSADTISSEYPSRYIALDGAEDIFSKNGGKVCLAVVCHCGSDNDYYYYREDGTKIQIPANPDNTGSMVIPAVPAIYPLPLNLWTVFDPAQSNVLATNVKGCEAYCFGSYVFQSFVPTDDEIRQFLAWTYHNSRVGNKIAYPPWASKT